MSEKLGLRDGSYDQQVFINWYKLGGQLAGKGSLSPASILPITSGFFTPWNGFTPYMVISHMHTPAKFHEHTWNINLLINPHAIN